MTKDLAVVTLGVYHVHMVNPAPVQQPAYHTRKVDCTSHTPCDELKWKKHAGGFELETPNLGVTTK